MDKDNGKGIENNSNTNKVSNPTPPSTTTTTPSTTTTTTPSDPGNLLDTANLFGAYWPRGDASSNAANLFASGFGLPTHPSLPFGMLPPTTGRGLSAYPTSTTAAAAAAAYSNAYTNTLSVAASQAASLGLPAASAAWWSMASHLAAQDYLARLQASGLNFPSLTNPTDLQYASLGLTQQLTAAAAAAASTTTTTTSTSTIHKSKNTKINNNSLISLPKNKDKSPTTSPAKFDGRLESIKPTNSISSATIATTSTTTLSSSVVSNNKTTGKYPTNNNQGLIVQPTQSGMKLPNNNIDKTKSTQKTNDLNSNKQQTFDKTKTSSSVKESQSPTPSIFTSPLTLASNFDKNSAINDNLVGNLPANSILSDPNSILGGVRLPPDTEIIKYTSSIVGPKIPGTTNRGRKKTISLDPPSVSLHPSHSSTGMLIERGTKRPKLNDQDVGNSSPPITTNDRVEVIKLPATNGSPLSFNTNNESNGEAPLNLSLKPTSSSSTSTTTTTTTTTSTTTSASSSLNSLSNMSANLVVDRISRRKPGPKPRRVLPPGTQLPPASASLAQLFATADSPRPPSRNNSENSDGGSSISSLTTTTTTVTTTPTVSVTNHKEGRPRNLGRGVSKPKKNTVASLLAQSRALGIKPMPILDPNITINQQMNLLKSNILAAQQYINEAGGDEKALNKFLQEKFRGTLSDSSTIDASTDSDNLTDSNHTDSEMEIEVANKKQKQYDERALRVPLEKGWKRETIIRGLTKNGGIKGDVTYAAPDSANKFKQMSDVTQYLEYQKSTELTKENFTFSCRVIVGDYLQPVPPEMVPEAGEFIYLSEDDVTRRLEELKTAMRTSIPVEQRIEMARKQQAARAAARLDRETARLAKEIERSERQEAARRDREARSQQLLEGRKRLAFTLEQKIQIISEIEGGKTKSDVSRELGLASSTVATIWKNRDNIINAYSNENLGRHSPIDNDNLFITNNIMAKRKRQEELERHKQEEQQRKQQEREFKRQQAAILKEQMYIQEISKQREMLYTVELERERRRQHMALVKALENRRKLEERERKKQQLLAEKQANKEKKLEQRKIELEILTELRKPCEDLELDQKPLPQLERINGLKLAGKAFADLLMVFEFLHNFGETLGFDMESLPTLDSLQLALLSNEHSTEAEEELFSVMTHLLVCAIEDPGIPNPARHTTILGQSLRQADITHTNLSEILRIYLYANATGEVKLLTGVHFERDREKRIADHHQNDIEMQQTQIGKNSQYYELLHENRTWKLSDMLKDKPFMALSPTIKAEILAFICNELLQNKAVIRQIETTLETVSQQRKEKWLLDTKIRKLKMLHSRKVRSEAVEKAQTPKSETESEITVDSPSLHKDDLLDDDENEMSENESVCTQPEEEEDNKLSGEELGKKLEKLVKQSDIQLQTLNTATGQLRATCYGQDRYWRRYWSLSKSGGIFVEAMESAEPETLIEQIDYDQRSLNEINKIIDNVVDNINDINVDKEVCNIVNGDDIDNKDQTNDNNEHRKTPNRLLQQQIDDNKIDEISDKQLDENGEILDKSDRNLAELRKSVDDIVQNLERNLNKENNNNNQLEESQEILNNHINNNDGNNESIANKKFNLFEKLGQCMERENKSEEDLKADVKAEIKEELKNEILSELKTEIKTESTNIPNKNEDDNKIEQNEQKWFSLLNKEGTCDGIFLTAGNRWDTGSVGACIRDNLTELKIPVFPPPNNNNNNTNNTTNNINNNNNNMLNYHNLCDSPAPLQMTVEESAQLEHIKKHGMPKACPRKSVPIDQRYGWWRIIKVEQLREILDNLHVRGVRERELKRNFIQIMQQMYENQNKLFIEEGQKDLIELSIDGMENIKFMDGGTPYPDEPGVWSPIIAHRVDLFLLEQVEALEDKVASASMQIKGWKIPNRDCPDLQPNQVVPVARERLASLEVNIERRYLKPPLGVKPSCINLSSTGDPNLVAIAQETGVTNLNQTIPDPNEIPKGLAVWREAVHRAQTSAQLAMCLYSLEASIAWDKSIMKAVSLSHVFNKMRARKYNSKLSNCQFCHSGDNEDKLLLCDGCDKGYHTYCFKPKMENIPDGDWYCYECMNKATGERNCIVCGKKTSTTGTKLILCELCPRAYHTDCIHPILHKVPRGKWYCTRCISKKPQKKTVRKNHQKPPTNKDSELSDHPSSPAPSHSSITTNEDQMTTNCNQSDTSNSSSMVNAGSPSTIITTTSSSSSSSSSSSLSSLSTTQQQQQQQQQQQTNKKERISKKLLKELAPCKIILEDLECHDDAWPFLLPVNTKQFPTYKKIIKTPMDLSTIKKKLYDVSYKSREEFVCDVRQIFNNCEVFNEDDSPVGKAGHCMRQFFEARWNELCISNS